MFLVLLLLDCVLDVLELFFVDWLNVALAYLCLVVIADLGLLLEALLVHATPLVGRFLMAIRMVADVYGD